MTLSLLRSLFKKPQWTPTLELGRVLSNLWALDQILLPMQAEKVRDLLSHGADPNGFYGKTRVWHLAVGYPAMLKVLLEEKPDALELNGFGELGFRNACPIESLLLLLSHGLDPNLVSNEDESLLHFLWERFDEDQGKEGTREALEAVLSAGANPELLEKHGGHRPYAPSIHMDRLLGKKPLPARERPEIKAFKKPRHAQTPLSKAIGSVLT